MSDPDRPQPEVARQLEVTPWPGVDGERNWVAEELPVAICYNGLSHVVMMATPRHCRELAVGFSLSEGIVDSLADIYGIEDSDGPDGLEVDLEISAACFQRLRQQRRHLAGRTGCGLCGRESLGAQDFQVPRVAGDLRLGHAAIQFALDQLAQRQPLHSLTGGVHGAAWCAVDGAIGLLMEDVGRHNALDKLIGSRLISRRDDPGFVLVSSRASYEIIQKSARAGIAVVVAVSAPTSLAVAMAQASGITLVAFARAGRHSVYSHGQRITEDTSP